MRAMILAAGLGTRLRPLTEDVPKALVEVGGRPLLEITIERLRSFGVREIIVNVHHFGEQVASYLAAHSQFGMRIEISREETLLDTGGGLRKAAWFFLEDPYRLEEPFILHNVDVLSSIDLEKMRQLHIERGALATLAVRTDSTERALLFDAEGRLCGHRSSLGPDTIVRDQPNLEPLEFTGIHVVSPRLLALMDKVMGPQASAAFSIITAYLRLAAAGYPIVAFDATTYEWLDVGSPENLERASPGRANERGATSQTP